MKNTQPSAKTIDEYISNLPAATREVMQQIRDTIRSAAPDASEAMAYQIPTFVLNGNLVHFGAFEKHIGFYPTPTGIAQFKSELKDYVHAKGSVQFPLDKPIPYDLIDRITRFRVIENLSKSKK